MAAVDSSACVIVWSRPTVHSSML